MRHNQTQHQRTSLVVTLFACCIVLAGTSRQTHANQTPTADGEELAVVQVFNESGEPVSGAEVIALETANDVPVMRRWKALDNGPTPLLREDFRKGTAGRIKLIVRAPGYAWATTAELDLDANERISVTLQKGKELRLKIVDSAGRELPKDFAPIIFTKGQSVAAWQMGVQLRTTDTPPEEIFSATHVVRSSTQESSEAEYTIHIPSDCDMLYCLINHPGFLRAFQAGPFSADQIAAGEIEVQLPRPRRLAVHVRPDPTAPHEYTECGAHLMVVPKIPDGAWAFPLPPAYSSQHNLKMDSADLAPREYHVTAFTGNRENRGDKTRDDYFERKGWFDLSSKDSGELTLDLQTFDEAFQRKQLRGEYNLTVAITNADGSPAAGKPYELKYSLFAFGREIDFAADVLPEDGVLRLANVGQTQFASLRLEIQGQPPRPLYLQGEEREISMEIRLPPVVGDSAPEIMMHPLNGSAPYSLSSLRGQVVYLEFWASWCGPCQAPMAEANAVVARRKEDWQDKVAVIGLSIDDKMETIVQHIETRGWHDVQQVWAGEGGWKSKPPELYAVTAVPTAILIDREGKIAWAGSPIADENAKSMEEKIDQLLEDGQ